MKLSIDLDTLTLAEMAEVEEISGSSIDIIGEPGRPKARLMIALAYVAQRRTDPTYTVAQAEALKMTDFDIQEEPTVDPQSAEGE